MWIARIAIIAAVAVVTIAKPHRYVHHHAHGVAKREVRHDNVVYAPVAIETVIKYVLDNHDISAEDVRLGLANGTLEWGPDGNLSVSEAVPVALPTSPPSPPPSEPSLEPPQQKTRSTERKSMTQPAPVQPVQTPTEKPSSQAQPQPPSQPAPESQINTSLKTAAQLVDQDGKCASCDIEFPNNKIPCTKFPYGYGAMPLQQEGLGGWSGIQDPGYRGADGYDYIRTVVSGSCNDGSCCTSGSWCSYGCPNPYLKLSFPKKQGRTGQSVGGLYCNANGMLEMADGAIGKTLCGKGSKNMTVKVQNKLSKSVSICRTDYPGRFLHVPITCSCADLS